MVRIILIVIFSVFTFTAVAETKDSTKNGDCRLHEYRIERLEQQNEELQKALDYNNKNHDEYCRNLIEGQKEYLNLFLGFITLLMGAGGFIGYRKVISTERREQMFENKCREDLDRFEINCNQTMESFKREHDLRVENITMKFDRLLSIYDDRLKDMDKQTETIVENIANRKPSDLDSSEAKSIREQVADINKFKSVSELTAKDYYLKAYIADDDKEYDDACFFLSKSAKLDSHSADTFSLWGLVLFSIARQNEDEDLLEQAMEKLNEAEILYPGYDIIYNNKAVILLWKYSRNKSDIELFEESLAALYKAEQLGNESCIYNFACLYSINGDKDKAFEYFERMLQQGKSLRKEIEDDPDFDGIRDDNRYKELLNRYLPEK